MKIFKPRQFAVWVYIFLAITLTKVAWADNSSASMQKAPAPLSTFILNNLTDHPDLMAAKADVQRTNAAVSASGQAVYNPELEFDYEDAGVKTRSIGISQTIDWGDQQGSRTSVAQAELLKAKADYDVFIQSFIRNLLTQLAQNQTEEELAQLSDETLMLMQEFKQIAERRYQSGDLDQVERNLAQLAYSEALMKQANQQAKALQAREQLKAMLTDDLPEKLPALPEVLADAVMPLALDDFLKQLPTMRSLLAEVQAARHAVAVRQSEKAWNPTIGFAAGSEGDESLIGINLSIPLNVRNNFSAEVDEAQQNLIAIEQRSHQAYRNLRADILSSAERYQQLQQVWNNWRNNSQKNVQQQLKLIKQLWRSGDMSTTDYLVQLKQALDIKSSGLELRGQLWQSAFDWMSNIASIDQWLNINIRQQENN